MWHRPYTRYHRQVYHEGVLIYDGTVYDDKKGEYHSTDLEKSTRSAAGSCTRAITKTISGTGWAGSTGRKTAL